MFFSLSPQVVLGQNELEFINVPVLKFGPKLQVGAVYLVEDVQLDANGVSGDSVDALITIVDSIKGATLDPDRLLDSLFASDKRFEPKVNYPEVGAAMRFQIHFIVAGSADSDISDAVPYVLEDFTMELVGLADNEWAEVLVSSAYVLEGAGNIITVLPGTLIPNATRFLSDGTDVVSDPANTEAVVSIAYRNVDHVDVFYGRNEALSIYKGISIGFAGQADYEEAVVAFVNDPPSVVSHMVSTVASVSTSLIDLLFGASDPDNNIDSASVILRDPNDILNFGEVGRPLVIADEGTYVLDSLGGVVFIPESGFLGYSIINFTVNDDYAEISNSAELTVAVLQNSIVLDSSDLHIWGTVFADANLDASYDFGEPGQDSVELILYKDENGDSLVDSGDIELVRDTTDENGSFVFSVSSTMYEANVRDSFSTGDLDNSNGSDDWSSSWVIAKPTTRIVFTGEVLNFHKLKSTYSVYRDVNLTEATSVQLSFYWQSYGLSFNEVLELEVSNDGGANYDSITSVGYSSASNFGFVNVDISSIASANTRIRFKGGAHNWEKNEYVEIDNLDICYTKGGDNYVMALNQTSLPDNADMTTSDVSTALFSILDNVDGDNNFGVAVNAIETDSVTKIGDETATFYGTIVLGIDIVEFGFYYSKDTTTAGLKSGITDVTEVPCYRDTNTPLRLIDSVFSKDIIDLINRSAFYYRSYSKNAKGEYFYGKTKRFITEKRDFSLYLDGDNDCVVIDKESVDKYINDWGPSDNTFSIDMWFKKVSPATERGALVNNLSDITGYDLFIKDGAIILIRPGQPSVKALEVITDTNWHHFALTYDGDSVSMYVDDILRVTKEAICTRPTNVTNCYIGCRFNPNKTTNALTLDFEGNIDALRFWNVALSADQISELLYDNVMEGDVLNTVKCVGSGKVIPSLAWNNLTASMGFNVLSTEEAATDYPDTLIYNDQTQQSAYPFFHNDARLGDDKRGFNAIAIGNATVSPYLPRAYWRYNATDRVWTHSNNWGAYAYPGQGVLADDYPDVTTVDLANDSAYCQYVIVDKSTHSACVIGVIPPEVQVLVDRDNSIGTYYVDDSAELTILKGVFPSLFPSRVEMSSGSIVIEGGAVEVFE